MLWRPCSLNTRVCIVFNFVLHSEPNANELSQWETNGRLSRYEIEKVRSTCARYEQHGSLEGLDNELTAREYRFKLSQSC